MLFIPGVHQSFHFNHFAFVEKNALFYKWLLGLVFLALSLIKYVSIPLLKAA